MTHTDKQYLESIQGATGRRAEYGSLPCDMCNGNGFSMFEPVCEACDGDGNVTAPIFSDCRCPVELQGDPDCQLCFPVVEETIEVVPVVEETIEVAA